MVDAAFINAMTPAEYLAFERASDEKHEYAQGEVFARADSTWVHGVISTNLAASLHAALAARPCTVAGPDIKVQASQKRRYHYPDVVVICGPQRLVHAARRGLVAAGVDARSIHYERSWW